MNYLLGAAVLFLVWGAFISVLYRDMKRRVDRTGRCRRH